MNAFSLQTIPDSEGFYLPVKAAAYSGYCLPYLRRLIQSGQVRGVRIGQMRWRPFASSTNTRSGMGIQNSGCPGGVFAQRNFILAALGDIRGNTEFQPDLQLNLPLAAFVHAITLWSKIRLVLHRATHRCPLQPSTANAPVFVAALRDI